jgi:hypothetical protein
MTRPSDQQGSPDRLSIFAMVNEVADKFDAAWQKALRGTVRPRIEDYLAGIPEQVYVDLLKELVAIELECRQKAGDEWSPDEYRSRFPDDVMHLKEILEVAISPGPSIPDHGQPPTVRRSSSTANEGAAVGRTASAQQTASHTANDLPTTLVARSASAFLGPMGHSDRFELQRQVGAGGMGIVYQALDRELGTTVALKLLPHVDPHALYRFKQEFRSLVDMVHPNLVRLYELFADGERWFFTMELIDGVNFLAYTRPTARENGRLRRSTEVCKHITRLRRAPTARPPRRPLRFCQLCWRGQSNSVQHFSKQTSTVSRKR